MMIDTHCHLSSNDYSNLDEVINHMGENIMITSGANMDYNHDVILLIEKYKNIYGTLGLHPDEADIYTENDLEFIENNMSNKKIVGVGEIGLDYRNGNQNKDNQIKLFISQLEIAKKYNKPVVIHSRDAIEDTYNIIKNYNLKFVIHCYSSSYEMAQLFIKLGAKLGIGGVVTFKNGKKIQEVVSKIGLENMLLETDSPCLAPEPYRGTTNEPYNITYVAQKIAEIKHINVDDVYNQTTKNALEVYNIKI